MRRRVLIHCLALATIAASAAASAQRHRPDPVPVDRMPPLPPAQIDDSLAIGGEDVDGRKVASRMTVAVQVNGQGPFRFVVDSGADTSVIGAAVARKLQLTLGTPVTLHGITASSRVDRVRVDRLRLGQSDFTDLELPVLQENDLGGAGMIGIDTLVAQRLMLDFEKRVIKIDDARLPAPHFGGEIVVVARRRRGQLILTQARVDGKPVDAVIDTGSEITIGNTALRERLARRYRGKLATITVTGVTGVSVNLEVARIAELQLGPIMMRDITIAFAEVPPFTVFDLSKQPALLLGTDLMETFRRVSLDFRARKVRFQLRRCTSEGVVLSTAISGDTSRLSLANGATVACRR